ncbi:MAG: LytTR family DNA-binding domain-containing protein [Saprospiraceae bacterium]
MRILIIEDEPAAARRIQKMTEELLPAAEIVGQLESIAESIAWLSNNNAPDLILLDIHLADGASFEIFQHCEVNTPIIFTTAYDQYALQAFKVNAVDYLLKPIKKEELQAALTKYQQHRMPTVDYKSLARAMQVESQEKRFLIRLGQQIKLVATHELAYAYTESKITFIVTKEGRRYPLDHSLEKLEEMLPSAIFFRINRQFIIGIHAIQEMHAYSKSRVKLILSPTVGFDTIVSTERSPFFKKWLESN